MKKIRIGITVGDPAGIGPEITKRALSNKSIRKLADFLIIDGSEGRKLKLGKPSRESGQVALENIDKAIELLKFKEIDALVTGPVSKEAINLSNRKFVGHTDYIASNFKVKEYVMAFISRYFRIALVSRHLPLKDVSRYLDKRKIYSTIRITADALNKLFNIKQPRIAVCGLNPHAGEGGVLGKEEKKIIIPAIKRSRKLGIQVSGPFAADALFFEVLHRKFDAVVAMYHDQGLIPIKMIDRFNAVNMTLGLPFVRTSPSHGTAFDIAGRNQANPDSMIEAIKLAVKCAKNKVESRENF